MRRPVVSLLTTTCAAAIALAACGGSDGPTLRGATPLAKMSNAVASTKGATIRGSFTPAAGTALPIDGGWSGTTIEDGTGSVRTGVVLGTTAVAFEARWLDKQLYVHRTASSPDAGTAGVAAFVVRPPGGSEWGKMTLGTFNTPFIDTYVVPALLDRLTRANVELRQSAPNTYVSQKPTLIGLDLAGATLEFRVDNAMRPTSVTVRARRARIEYAVDWSAVPKVSSPPADKTGPLLPPVEAARPAGAFTAAASGSQGGTWTLERAPGTKGTTCWRLDATPAIPLNGTDASGVRCLAAPASDAEPADRVSFVAESAHGATRDFVAAILPDGARDLVVGYVGGRVVPTAVPSPASTPFVDNSALDTGPAYLAMTLTDGTRVECGRGAIAIVADLSDSNLTGNVAGTPWTCDVN